LAAPARAVLPLRAVADAPPLCATVGPAGKTPLPVKHLAVASFNLLHGQEDYGAETLKARLPLQLAALAATGADIVGVQESSVTTSNGNVIKKLAEGLAASTGTGWTWCWFESNPHFPLEPDVQPGGGGGPLTEVMVTQARAGEDEFREGVGILTRLPVVASAVRRQPPRSYEGLACIPPDPLACNAAGVFDSRAVLWARLTTAAGDVDVFNTHLAHGITPLSPETKRLETIYAMDYIHDTARFDAAPDFFLGDFNSPDGSQVGTIIRRAGFLDTFRAVNPLGAGFTGDQDIHSPVSTTTERIDYVYARPGGCDMKIKRSDTFPDAPTLVAGGPLWPSDHHGVVTDFDIC
jgi:endonuclease/exonuclease/phosphatase family metal-dependent hydrolase